MSYLKSLDTNSVLLDVFREYSQTSIMLLEFHEIVMRGPSPFTPAERELIAAYVSGLNMCGYCHGVHTATAVAFGISEQQLSAMLDDLDSADVDQRLRPVLRYARKLTESPSQITADDAEQLFAAGWDDQALYDLVTVTALFNYMNRLVEGLGIAAEANYFQTSAQRLKQHGYRGVVPLITPNQP